MQNRSHCFKKWSTPWVLILLCAPSVPVWADTPADASNLVTVITKSFATLDGTLNNLLGTGDNSTQAGKNWTSFFSTIIHQFQQVEAKNTKDQAAWDANYQAMWMGLKQYKPNPSSNASMNFTGTGAPPPPSGLAGLLAPQSAKGHQVPQGNYNTLQQYLKTTQFNGPDYPYNPSTGFDQNVNLKTAAEDMSIDGLISGSPNGQGFSTILINPAGVPDSIQDMIYGLYQQYQKNFQTAAKHGNPIYKNNQLISKLQNYQSLRRRYLAMLNVAASNLEALPRLGGGNNTHATIQKIMDSDWDNADAVTLAKLNLIANLMVADEISKKGEMEQRLLATMSVLVLQGLQGTEHQLFMQERSVQSQLRSSYNLPKKPGQNYPSPKLSSSG